MPLREQMTNRRFEACLLIARRHDHRAAHAPAVRAVRRCGERLERRQPPRPPLVVERGQAPGDEQGSRTEKDDGHLDGWRHTRRLGPLNAVSQSSTPMETRPAVLSA